MEKTNPSDEQQSPSVTRTETKVKKSGGGCLKFLVVFFLILILIFAGVAAAGWWALNKFLANAGGLNLPNTATVEIITGTLEQQTGGNWQTVIDGAVVENGTMLKTDDNSEAAVTFPSGSQIRLDENTQITVVESNSSTTSISQTGGRTWSRIGKLLGQTPTYEVETPTVVATVRGTAFATEVLNGDTSVDADDGEVEVGAYERISGERKILEKLIVVKNFGVDLTKKDIVEIKAGKKQMVKRALRRELENSNWMKDNRARDRKFLDKLKAKGMKPMELINMVRAASPADLMKLQSLAQKIANKEITPTESQIEEFAAIGESLEASGMTDNIARRLAALAKQVDPANFSDTNHWTNVFKNIAPLMRIRMQQRN